MGRKHTVTHTPSIVRFVSLWIIASWLLATFNFIWMDALAHPHKMLSILDHHLNNPIPSLATPSAPTHP